MKYTYLLIDLSCVAVPFLFSFHPAIKFYRDFRPFFAANAISACCFIAWDMIFTEQGFWGFNEEFITGIKIYNLPIEEILFFVCIPFACVFSYRCFNMIFKNSWNNNDRIITMLISVILFVIGIWHWRRAYTATTFISISLLIVLVRFIFRQRWIGNLYRAWLLLLPTFLIVNGLLTGTGLSSPVVWYNNEETLGVRILTIPVEDIVYSLELLMLTTFFYELLLMISKTKVRDRGSVSKMS